MKNIDLEERLLEFGYEGSVILRNYDYETAIIGVDTEGRVVYSFEKMVKYLIDNEKMTEEEAIEWIEYNTIRALPYMGNKAPIIVKELPE